MRLTLKATLLSIVTALVLLMAGQAYTAITKSRQIQAGTEDIATNWLPSVKLLGDLKYLTTRVRLFEARIVLYSDAATRSESQTRLVGALALMQKKLDAYQALITGLE